MGISPLFWWLIILQCSDRIDSVPWSYHSNKPRQNEAEGYSYTLLRQNLFRDLPFKWSLHDTDDNSVLNPQLYSNYRVIPTTNSSAQTGSVRSKSKQDSGKLSWPKKALSYIKRKLADLAAKKKKSKTTQTEIAKTPGQEQQQSIMKQLPRSNFETTLEPILGETEAPMGETTMEPVLGETVAPIVETTVEPTPGESNTPTCETTLEPTPEETDTPMGETTQLPISGETDPPIVDNKVDEKLPTKKNRNGKTQQKTTNKNKKKEDYSSKLKLLPKVHELLAQLVSGKKPKGHKKTDRNHYHEHHHYYHLVPPQSNLSTVVLA